MFSHCVLAGQTVCWWQNIAHRPLLALAPPSPISPSATPTTTVGMMRWSKEAANKQQPQLSTCGEHPCSLRREKAPHAALSLSPCGTAADGVCKFFNTNTATAVCTTGVESWIGCCFTDAEAVIPGFLSNSRFLKSSFFFQFFNY